MRIIAVFSLFLFAAMPSASADAAEELRVEGIVTETNPDNSVALINGEALKKGDHYRGYHVEEVAADSVTVVKDDTGEKTKLEVSGMPPVQTKKETAGPQALRPSADNAAPDFLKLFGLLNPFGYIKKAQEIQGMSDSKTIYMAAMVYGTREEDSKVTFKQLVESGLLSRVYEKGVHAKYQFALKTNPQGVEVSAEPLEPRSGLTHFLIDSHGVFHAEKGKPATDASPEPEL